MVAGAAMGAGADTVVVGAAMEAGAADGSRRCQVSGVRRRVGARSRESEVRRQKKGTTGQTYLPSVASARSSFSVDVASVNSR